MTLLDLQRKGYQQGRIRIGQQVPTGKTRKDGTPIMRPDRLSTFRFTTPSESQAHAVAELYGGEVRTWLKEWEVITGRDRIGVTIPPRGEVISQWYEMWTAGGCIRRCDSATELISGQPCQCPGDAEDRAAAAKANPPEACKIVTRLSVMIPDLPGLGVFRIDTGSYYAAVEIGDAAEVMTLARERGVYLPAELRIEQRTRVARGQTKHYPVPVLELLVTFRELVSGAVAQRPVAEQLPPPDGARALAIAAAAKQPAAITSGGSTDAVKDAAQKVYDEARRATTRDGVTACAEAAKAAGLDQVDVCVSRFDDIWADLHGALQDLWKDLDG